MNVKSPFYIVEDFLSPQECEDIVARSFFEYPTTVDGSPIKSTTRNLLTENRILQYFTDILDDIEDYYDYEHRGILPLSIEYYPQGMVPEGFRCENSVYDSKWRRVNDNDLTGIVFLKTSVQQANLDPATEVYGSRLEFSNHNFGFTPQIGQLIIFPSGPNFLNSTLPAKLGDMYQIRVQFVGEDKLEYNPRDFPGDYRTWFN
jgi:hypothetical protein